MKLESVFLFLFVITTSLSSKAQLPAEQPLWPKGLPSNTIIYKEEKVRSESFLKSSLSQNNRVFSCVSVPSYVIHTPEKGKGTGVAMVICPGGGFRDVWFDREGNDFGLWLAQHGVTALVLKYRTFNADAEGFKVSQDDYMPQVYADAAQAISTLRNRATELGINKNKIGIGGFSAGGMLSLMSALSLYDKNLPAYEGLTRVNSKPDFVGLFYPGLHKSLISLVGKKDDFPPSFIMNGGEDTTTPAVNCIELYRVLTEKNFSSELHIWAKGTHGFDSGIERGYGIATWRDSFIAWLKDKEFIQYENKR